MKRPKKLPVEYRCELCGDVIREGQDCYRVTQGIAEVQLFLDTGTILHRDCAASDIEAYKRKKRYRRR